MKIIGLEVPNSYVKAFTKSGSLVYPNTTRLIHDTELVVSLIGSGRDIFTYNGQNFEVGLPTNTGSGSKSENRYRTEEFKREFLFAVAQLVDEPNEEVYVVTGVPSETSKNEEIEREIREHVVGEYTITINQKDIKTFKIVDVKVIAQPLGTLLSYLFHLNGEEKRPGEASKNSLVIDIGWGTTDIVAFEEMIIKERDSFPIGMSDHIRRLSDRINSTYPKSRIANVIKSPYQLDLLARKGDLLEIATGSFDISEISKVTKKETANIIYERVSTMGFNFDSYHNIILTGGGAAALSYELLKEFNNPRVVIAEDAQIANVIGFYIYGLYTYNS